MQVYRRDLATELDTAPVDALAEAPAAAVAAEPIAKVIDNLR